MTDYIDKSDSNEPIATKKSDKKILDTEKAQFFVWRMVGFYL